MTPKRPRTMPTPCDETAILDGVFPWDAVRKLGIELSEERSVQDQLAAALQALLDISPFSVQPGDVDIHRAVDAALARWQGAEETNGIYVLDYLDPKSPRPPSMAARTLTERRGGKLAPDGSRQTLLRTAANRLSKAIRERPEEKGSQVHNSQTNATRD